MKNCSLWHLTTTADTLRISFLSIYFYLENPNSNKFPSCAYFGIDNQVSYSHFHFRYICNTCALSKHMGNMCMRLRNAGKGEASPSLFPRFAPNTHIYLYASTVHMYCIYPAILNRK